MSANNNRRNNTDQNRAPDLNRIRGPTSALTSFLREHGIRVENRSRQQMMERRRQRREEMTRSEGERQAEAAAGETPPTGSAAQHDTPNSPSTPTTSSSTAESSPSTPTATTESILYTPASSSRRSRSAQAQAIINAASSSSSSSSSKGKKKKRPADDSSDSDFDGDSGDDDDFLNSQPTSSRTRSSSTRIRVLFCSRCKCRFVRNNSDPSEETMCPDCLAGKDPAAQKKKPAAKKRNAKKGVWFMHDVTSATATVSSLQEICINVIADHIDDVEALGDISFMNMDRIAKIICRKRQLTNHIARLFMQPNIRELCLYDCTNVDETGLKNIAHFCPNLRTLRLYYCGRMSDEVIELYGTHLQHLTSLTVSGCHLVTDAQWTRFFEMVGDRLKSFSIRHSYRFKKTSFKSLVNHCNQLQHLCLSRIVTLSDDWLDIFLESGINTLETLELSWPSEEPDRKCILTTDHLTKVLAQTGASLKELTLRGCTELTDDVVVDGILPHCRQLRKLTLEGCPDISSAAFQRLFSTEWQLAPVFGPHRQTITGLQMVSVARCLHFDDDALMALLRHSGKALTRLDIHSLEKLTVSALEAIAGEVVTLDGKENNNGDNSNDKENSNDDGSNGYVTGGPGSGKNQRKRLKLGSGNGTAEQQPDTDTSTLCTLLTYLDASFVRAMDDYVLTKLIRSCPNLNHVKVWGCHQVTDVVEVPPKLVVEGREFV